MDSLWITGYENEIERCKKLYDNFDEGAGFIKSVFDAISKYDDQHHTQIPPIDHLSPPAEESIEMMKQDQSLKLRPDLNAKQFSELFKTVCSEATKANPALKKIMSDLLNRTDIFLSGEGKVLSLEKIKEFRDLLKKEAAIENDMATFLFSIVLSSIYRRQFESIPMGLRTDLYEGGDCPLCGEQPHFGMLCPEDGAKVLECWLCGSRWLHSRVKCPYCRNEDREELGYFTIEGNDNCRVNYCLSCRRYYKIIDARNFNTDGNIVLTIHNLASLGYDILARKEGFSPGSGLEWVNENELSDRQD